jgi:SAM-dependent methyltransferase
MTRDQGRLVEATPEYSPAVRRDRNQNALLFGHARQQHASNQAGQSDLSPVFEFQDDGARQIPIGSDSNGSVMIRRFLDAWGTNGHVRGDRNATEFAASSAQEFKRLPAFCTELQIGDHNFTTTSASGGKSERNDIRKHITHNQSCCDAATDAQGLIMMPPEIFDRTARRQLRERVLRYPSEDRWLIARMAQDILDRLDAVRTPFEKALVIGGNPVEMSKALASRNISCVDADLATTSTNAFAGIVCDEDRLPFADGCVDLVIAVGTLDTVSDLPGALVLIQRILRSNGLFIGSMMGAGSLPFLRSCLQQSDKSAPVVARFHPQIDVRGAGDLLARAHFSLPVAESENVSARYRTLDRLVGDLRANGLTNCLAQRVPLKKADYAELAARFSEPVVEHFSIVTLTGWARPEK